MVDSYCQDSFLLYIVTLMFRSVLEIWHGASVFLGDLAGTRDSSCCLSLLYVGEVSWVESSQVRSRVIQDLCRIRYINLSSLKSLHMVNCSQSRIFFKRKTLSERKKGAADMYIDNILRKKNLYILGRSLEFAQDNRPSTTRLRPWKWSHFTLWILKCKQHGSVTKWDSNNMLGDPKKCFLGVKDDRQNFIGVSLLLSFWNCNQFDIWYILYLYKKHCTYISFWHIKICMHVCIVGHEDKDRKNLDVFSSLVSYLGCSVVASANTWNLEQDITPYTISYWSISLY